MSTVRHSTSHSSVTSSPTDYSEDVGTTQVKNYVKNLLKSRIFLGRYVERRLADHRVGYRDIVIISPAEAELKRDLQEAQHKLHAVFPFQWIGITDTDLLDLHTSSGVCLWTEIDNQPFGLHWFQIKSVKFRDTEVTVTVKCLRHITDSFLEAEPILTGALKKPKESDSQHDSKMVISQAALSDTYNDIVVNLRMALSISNVKEFVTFLFAFVIAVFTGSTAFVNFLGNFILALVRELSILVKNSTPLFLGFLDFVSKIVGGFYILLAMFFKPNNPGPINKRSITRHSHPYRDEEINDSRQFD